jgi:hypothetical protein
MPDTNAVAPGDRRPVLHVNLAHEMRTYDALPAPTRRRLANAPFSMSATRIAPIVAKFGAAIAAKVIDDVMRIFASEP